MARLTAEQLAELVPCPVEHVERLAELGVLVRDAADGAFPSSAVHVVRLMEAFAATGVPVEDVARGVAAGALSFPLGLFLPEPESVATTYERLGAELGRPPDVLRRLSVEFGLPPAEDDRVRAEDAEMLALVVRNLDLADEDELSRFARLYGASVQRLVAAGLQFFDRTVRRRAEGLGLPHDEADAFVYERAGRYTELVARVVPWLQRRHREHAVLEYLVGVTEEFMAERGITPRQERQPPAIAFLDLTGFTKLADEHGDEAVAALAADLGAIVHEAAQSSGSQPVKWLGDGVMFHFADASSAIRGSLELLEQTERAISVAARMGVNAGPVVVQDGDYFGRTVNVAARIADYARPHEVLVSDDAMQAAGAPGVEFELVGDVRLRGVSTPVRLHRARRAA